MLRIAATLAALAGTAFMLVACDTPPRREAFPQLTYDYLPPIRLDVARIEIVDAYRAPVTDAHVERDFPTPPATAARQWASDRLKAVGADGVARFIIEDASVVDVPLPRTTGLAGMLTQDQSDRYDATVTVRLEVENRMGSRRGAITATAKRSDTAAEDMTLNRREKLWFDMTDQLLRQLNAELEAQINTHLREFLR
jgi:hypothetical protein